VVVKRGAEGFDTMNLNMKILIVDDFATMRKILKNVLTQIGFTNITEAEDGERALSALKKDKYDLILCDWSMPEMPGIELLGKIKSDHNLKEIPFIMVTAEAKKDKILEAVKAGVSNYIVKPFTTETVDEKLKQTFDN
jgi:two-component system chemotaxis response regulator CheY